MPRLSSLSPHPFRPDAPEVAPAAMPGLIFAGLVALLLLIAALSPAEAEEAAPAGVPDAGQSHLEPTLATPNNSLPARDTKAKAQPPAAAVPQTAAVEPDAPAGEPGRTPATRTTNQPIRGVVRPSAQANIATDLTMRVARIGFKPGQSFRSGEVLISFDCARLKAELTSAEALQREMKASYRSAEVLLHHRAGSRLDLETSKARLDRATADLDAMRQRISQCTILAPYDGSVVDVQIHEFEMPTPGKSLLSIVSRKDPEIELVVPSSWLTWLTPGATFEFFVEETGKTYPAKVQRLGATADTVSQTLKVFAVFSSQAPTILPGSSGTARFANDKG